MISIEIMPQEQRQIPLRLSNGVQKIAIAFGNNAAWLCICERMLPLLGRTGSVKGVAENTRIDCPDCERRYFVLPDGYDQAAAREVIEIT
jgi:hypothetical protein